MSDCECRVCVTGVRNVFVFAGSLKDVKCSERTLR